STHPYTRLSMSGAPSSSEICTLSLHDALPILVGTNIAGAGFTEKLLKWSYRHGVKKPSLDIYRLFIDELPAYNLKAEEVLYVGNDLFKDVIPAKKLGMKTALFVGDRRSIRHKKSDLIRKQMPDIIIDELSQIEECVT